MGKAEKTYPRCSVILCTYNRRNSVLTTLASLRRQTLAYEQFEVIVVDNGSHDGTYAAVNAYVHAGPKMVALSHENTWQVRCLVEEQNGLSYARNTGVRAAIGEIVVFLDDDVLAHPLFLECLLKSYDETGADAIGGRVELRWEAKRPHWLHDELLDTLGYFSPASTRLRLSPTQEVRSCNFSLKRDLFRAIGFFSPLLSKRSSSPLHMDVVDLCRRLHANGYSLWYEPHALVEHRVSAARLTRPYFVGRAYWQGRSEILAQYADTQQHQAVMPHKLPDVLRAALPEAREIARIALIDRLLLFFAGKPSSEKVAMAMAQARKWGHLAQRLAFVERAPAELTTPSVFFVRPTEHDLVADLLLQGLATQHIRVTTSIADIPLSWLWRHRALQGNATGILHIYRAGAFVLASGERQRFWFLLWLAKRWGIRIVTSDTGGWWQSASGLNALPQRVFERALLRQSDIILSFTRQPDQLYPDRRLRRRVRSLTHPGFRALYSDTPTRATAQALLKLPRQAPYVYLCLATHHNERELLALLDAFAEIQKRNRHTLLLLVGTAHDKQQTLLQRIAHNPSILTYPQEPTPQDIAWYMRATDAIVLPHFAQNTAGMLEIAMLALSFERRIVVPDLPRFRGMLPPRATAIYDPTNRASLVSALQAAQHHEFSLKPNDKKALEARTSWSQYAHRLAEIYKQALKV